MKRLITDNVPIPLLAFLLLAVLLAACGGGSDAADTVEAYIEAKVQADSARIRQLICSDLEGTYQAEAMTFAGVSNATIEDMSCTQTEENRVTCTGRIVALYGTEENEFPLTAYRVVQEGGEWKWCGEDY